MLKESAAEGINVRIRVFNFADGAQNVRNGLEALSGEVADVVVLDVSVSKRLQMHKSGISVSQDCVTVARDNSTFSQSFSDELLDSLLVGFLSFMEFFEGDEPLEAFLVGESVKGSSKTVHGS